MSPRADILVVDDDPNLLDLIIDTLNSIGYRAKGVINGEAALRELIQNEYQLVISDIKMPRMDGFELLTYLRKNHPNLPVLLISGYAEPEMIGRAVPDGFLAKPFRINLLEEMIEQALSGQKETHSHPIKTVLVVDDDEHFREMVCDVLTYHDYLVTPADSGEKALEILPQGGFDAVVTDLKMPGIDGFTLAGKIKSLYPQTPVIVITAFFDKVSTLNKMAKANVNGILKKPFPIESVVELLENLSHQDIDKPNN